jgi:hypothetical protein
MVKATRILQVMSILALSVTLGFTGQAPILAQTAAPTPAATPPNSYVQWASDATATSQYGDTSWSAQQAAGVPNVPGCADNGNAWASKEKTGVDTLTVTFSSPSIPTELDIYETFNPGSITGVELIPTDGSKTIPIGQNISDVGASCPSIFKIPVSGITGTVKGAIIHLDQTKSQSWDEIDAVQLIGILPPGVATQWASSATATTQYGDPKWSAMQASSSPNVTVCGDNNNAWASSQSNGVDTLTVKYIAPMIPTQVNIYESYNPGSITSIDLIPADGSAAIPVPKSADSALKACPGVFSVTLSGVTQPINAVAIHLDQTKSASWDEIDAVQMLGTVATSNSSLDTLPATAAATP